MNIDLEKIVDDMVSAGEITQIPVVAQFFTIIKNRNFNKRLREHNEKIEEIFNLIPDGSFDYFGIKLGTSVIQKILLDEEEEKVEFLLLGYENTVKKSLHNYDKTIAYFDLVANLRCADIKRLVFLSQAEKNPPNIYVDETLIKYIDNKLENTGLILRESTWASLGGKLDRETNLESVKVSNLGKEIIDFIGV